MEPTLARRMTSQLGPVPDQKFVPLFLPWLVAAGALAVYLLTLNHWVSFSSLFQVARISGWEWHPDLYTPINWLVTYPFRWLPARLIAPALNAFSAVCAALTLALLARSVALLPHDRTHEQRQKEPGPFALLSIRASWIPPVLAVLVCGLQLTFWESATVWAGSCEMLDLLLFAYIIRCLLEFRVDQRESWLFRAALVYGASMTNDWAMVGFFPLFLVALVWLRGLAFFNVRFLVRMFLCGLAGLSLYLLLPLVQSRTDVASVPFWSALKINLSGQKFVLATLLSKNNLLHAEKPLWILSLFSLLPVLLLSVRWPSYFGDTSKLGIAVATFTFHLVHGLFLLLCLFVALDPPFSPRFHPFRSLGVSFLALSYLAALSIGYFSGYFLLLFASEPNASRRTTPGSGRLFNRAVIASIWVLLIGIPALLICKNLPSIRTTNGSNLSHYASLLAEGLPDRGAVLLSDDPRRLFLLQAAFTRSARKKDYLFIDTASMPLLDYQRFLKKKYAQRWPAEIPRESKRALSPALIAQIFLRLAQTNSLCYLHPSFGYYFEIFYPEPHGLTSHLVAYPTNSLFAPVLTKDLIDENNAFWARAQTKALDQLLPAIKPFDPRAPHGIVDDFLVQAHLKKEPNHDALVLGEFYSRGIDFWGVQLQRTGDLPAAAAFFARAQQLNPANSIAKINLEFNHNFQAGRKSGPELRKAISDAFDKYRDWDTIMGENGPFDEPISCYQAGLVYARSGLYRQAATQFDRAKTLDPENLSASLWLAETYIVARMPDQALQLVDEFRSRAASFDGRTNQTELLFIETSARLAKDDLDGAQAAVQKALDAFPADETLLGTAAQVFMNYGRFTNALPLIERQLKLKPDNLSALLNKGFANLQAGAFEQAIPAFTRVLNLETNRASEVHNTALLDRAIAYLRTEQLDESQGDYEALQKAFPTAYRVYYGLEEIAYRKKDTNAAIRNCELYLAHAPTNTDEAKFVSSRLKELKPASP